MLNEENEFNGESNEEITSNDLNEDSVTAQTAEQNNVGTTTDETVVETNTNTDINEVVEDEKPQNQVVESFLAEEKIPTDKPEETVNVEGQTTDFGGSKQGSANNSQPVNNPQYNYNNGSYYGGDNNGNKNKKSSKATIIVAIIAGCIIIGLVIALVFTLNSKNGGGEESAKKLLDETNTEESTETQTYESVDSTGSIESGDTKTGSVYITDVSDVVENSMPAIVAITSQTKVSEYDNFSDIEDFYNYFYGYDNYDNDSYDNSNQDAQSDAGNDDDEQYEDTGAGSGIIIEETDSELLIVTNNHVVEGADALSILFNDGTSVKGSVKATDSTADIAIVAIPLSDIPSDTLKAIKTATLGNSDDLQVGDGVIAIGNALGYGQSVTTGVISAKDRTITVDDKQMTVLQTDAAINGGNSGGALLNDKGEVIGINVAKYSSSVYSSSASIEGMGFAIPISAATKTIDTLKTKKTRNEVDESERGYLGIMGRTIDSDTAQMYSMPTGVYVTDVYSDSAADKAGIQVRDVIVSLDDYKVSTMEDLQERLTYYAAEETVDVVVSRVVDGEYKEVTLSVTLESAESLTGQSKSQSEETTESQNMNPFGK